MKKLSILFLGAALFAGQAFAETKEFLLTIKDHKFTPESLEIPANEKVKIIIDNQDPTPEEFESHALNREKIIKGNSKGVVYIGPLDAGEYEYVGEFNEDSAKGKIVVIKKE